VLDSASLVWLQLCSQYLCPDQVSQMLALEAAVVVGIKILGEHFSPMDCRWEE